MIKTGGMRVSAEEIEEVLLDQEDVLEAGVVLKPDREFRVSRLMAHCVCRLARFKRPATVHQLRNLPRSANQKILRRELGEQLRLLHVANREIPLDAEKNK